MLAVIFKVYPEQEYREVYFSLAKELSFYLEQIDGLISIERFVSVADDGKILTLSFWSLKYSWGNYLKN